MSRKPADFQNHPMPFPNPYIVRGVVRHVVDGDTIDVLIDMGLNQYSYVIIRVRGIDTPEMVGKHKVRGHEAKAFTQNLVEGKPVRLTIFPARQTFGRYVADVEFPTETGWIDLATTVRNAGYDDNQRA
jgi:endonuclease YncB( thermonuclease family)